MTMTLRETWDRLSQFEQPLLLGSASGPCLIVSRRFGARVMAASPVALGAPNVLWVNTELGNEDFHSDESRNWNVGGHRTWLAPEDAFYLDSAGNWFVPSQMDPGDYQPDAAASEDQCSFTNSFDISTRNGPPGGGLELQLRRRIALCHKPPGELSRDSLSDVSFISFEVAHALRNIGPQVLGEDLPHVGLWSLLQVSPPDGGPGTMIIPTQGSPAYTDYFDPVPEERRWLGENVITFKIDGAKRGKMGIAPEIAPEAIGYMSEVAGTPLLVVKQFSIKRDGLYLDRPWGKERANGDAVQAYNDDGEMGGFAEMECHAAAQSLARNQEQSHTIVISAFVGPLDRLKTIGSRLLGTDLEKVHYFS